MHGHKTLTTIGYFPLKTHTILHIQSCLQVVNMKASEHFPGVPQTMFLLRWKQLTWIACSPTQFGDRHPSCTVQVQTAWVMCETWFAKPCQLSSPEPQYNIFHFSTQHQIEVPQFVISAKHGFKYCIIIYHDLSFILNAQRKMAQCLAEQHNCVVTLIMNPRNINWQLLEG